MMLAALESDRPAPRAQGTIVEALAAAAAADAPLATFHGGSAGPTVLDARATFARANAWAQRLVARGVRRGDRVVILVPTGPTFVAALLGAMMAGAAAVPLATPLTFGSVEPFLRNLGPILLSADARALVTTPRVLGTLASHRGSLHVPTAVLVDGDEPSPEPRPLPSVDPQDTALIQYTSGTTGLPKGVVISHRALVANAASIAEGLGLDARDVGVSWLPLFHDMGLVGVLLTAVCHPYALHLAAPEYFAMGAERWLHLIARVGATITAAPNFAYQRCVARAARLEGVRLDALRLALNGAEPVHAETLRRLAATLAPHGFAPTASLPVYGMAECTLAVTFADRGAPHALKLDRGGLEREGIACASTAPEAREVVSVGRPVAGAAIRVVDSGRATVPNGRVGRILVRSPSLMDGYFRNEAATRAVLADGWLDSGDLGFVADGQLYVTGRAKDVVIQGGRNIDPHDVERTLETECGLRPDSVVAFGVSDSSVATERLVLVVEAKPTEEERSDARARELRGAVLAALGARIDEVIFVALGSIPRTTSGKPRRAECARLHAEARS